MPHRHEQSAPPARSPAEQARFVAALTDMFEQRIRFNEVLGLRLQSIAPPAPSLRFDMRRFFSRNTGVPTSDTSSVSARRDGSDGRPPAPLPCARSRNLVGRASCRIVRYSRRR